MREQMRAIYKNGHFGCHNLKITPRTHKSPRPWRKYAVEGKPLFPQTRPGQCTMRWPRVPTVIPHIEMVGVHNNHPSHIRRRLGVEALSCGCGGSWRGWWPRGRVRGKWAARAAQFPPQHELLPPPRLWSIVHSGHGEREIALGDLFNAEVEAVAAAGSRAACFACAPHTPHTPLTVKQYK